MLCYLMERHYGCYGFEDVPGAIMDLLQCDSGALTPRKIVMVETLLFLPMMTFKRKILEVSSSLYQRTSIEDILIARERCWTLQDIMAYYQKLMCPVAHYLEFHKNRFFFDPRNRMEMTLF